MRRVRVDGVIERDEGRVMLSGTVVATGAKVTFAVTGEQAAMMANLVEAGEHVEVDL